ncbi:hypothetical protein KAR91_21370 [Candidatus Pacearchaeota archaeon]|nr:hypothetical protein [Candidatus Pacearchaeota archaeon]
MELQFAMNAAMGFIVFLGGWIMKIFWSSLTTLSKQVQELDILVAGQYVPREEYREDLKQIFDKLDEIRGHQLNGTK